MQNKDESGMKDGMKQQKLVEKMTIEEKAAILSGKTVWQTREIDRLSIPSIFSFRWTAWDQKTGRSRRPVWD